MALLSLREVGLSFGGPRLLDGADLQIDRGERVCLLGRNGEGKTSLMRLIHGEISPDDGLVERQQGLRVALLPQDVPEGLGGSVAEEVARGLSPSERRAEATDHRVERRVVADRPRRRVAVRGPLIGHEEAGNARPRAGERA